MLLKATQLNGGGEQPLEWGKIHVTKQLLAFALFSPRQGRNPDEPRLIFYDKYYHIIFLIDCVIKTALYI